MTPTYDPPINEEIIPEDDKELEEEECKDCLCTPCVCPQYDNQNTDEKPKDN